MMAGKCPDIVMTLGRKTQDLVTGLPGFNDQRGKTAVNGQALAVSKLSREKCEVNQNLPNCATTAPNCFWK